MSRIIINTLNNTREIEIEIEIERDRDREREIADAPSRSRGVAMQTRFCFVETKRKHAVSFLEFLAPKTGVWVQGGGALRCSVCAQYCLLFFEETMLIALDTDKRGPLVHPPARAPATT